MDLTFYFSVFFPAERADSVMSNPNWASVRGVSRYTPSSKSRLPFTEFAIYAFDQARSMSIKYRHNKWTCYPFSGKNIKFARSAGYDSPFVGDFKFKGSAIIRRRVKCR